MPLPRLIRLWEKRYQKQDQLSSYLTIDYVARSEKLEKTSSLRKLTRMGFEVYVAKSYERGKLTLREAAHLLHLNLMETIDLLNDMGVKGNIKAKDVMEGLKALP